jgi:hypothetical protein
MNRAELEQVIGAELAKRDPRVQIMDSRTGMGVGGLSGNAPHLGEYVRVRPNVAGPVTEVVHDYSDTAYPVQRIRLNAFQDAERAELADFVHAEAQTTRDEHEDLAKLIGAEGEETREAARRTHNRKVRVTSKKLGTEVYEYPRVPAPGERVWTRGKERKVRDVVQYPQPFRFAADVAVDALRGDGVPVGWIAAGAAALAAVGLGAWWWTGRSSAQALARATYPDGTLIKASGDAIDVVVGGLRHHVPDPATLVAQFGSNPTIRTVTDAAFAAVPAGTALPRTVAAVSSAAAPTAPPAPGGPPAVGQALTSAVAGVGAVTSALGQGNPLSGLAGGQGGPLQGLGGLTGGGGLPDLGSLGGGG